MVNARTVALLSLCLGLAAFAGQPVAANGGGGGKKQGDDKAIGGKPGGGGGRGKKQEDVMATVKKVVNKAIADKPGVGAALIRLVFHDCWVNGCDGSVLLDGSNSEKKAKNNIGLGGFDVIDNIKSNLTYPDKVSCADILVLAARQATINLSRGKITYEVTTGRNDSVVSSADAADKILPHSTFNVTQLKENFFDQGFNATELAVLSGAHTVGVAHFSSFQDRLDPATETPIETDYQTALHNDTEAKKSAGVADPIEPINIRDAEDDLRNRSGYVASVEMKAARGVLDNSYYTANLQNRGLFRSDWELRIDPEGVTSGAMQTFMDDEDEWYRQFGAAMKKLSDLKGKGSQIRKNCRAINKAY